MEECQLLLKYYSQPLEIATDGTLAEMIKKNPPNIQTQKLKKPPKTKTHNPQKSTIILSGITYLLYLQY